MHVTTIEVTHPPITLCMAPQTWAQNKNYIKVDTPCENKSNKTQEHQLLLLYGSLMQATHGIEMNPRPLLYTRSKTSSIYPHLQSEALLSIGKICEDVCTATSNATQIIVEKKGNTLLEGTRKGVYGMWNVKLSTTPHPIPTTTRQSANNLMTDRTKPDLEQWYHTTLFSTFK